MNEIVVHEATEVTETVKVGQPAQASVTVSRALARNRFDDLRKMYRRHIDWHIAVRDHLAGMREAPSVSKMPSKALKHQMYDTANWFLRHYGINVARPQSLAGVAAVLTAAEIRLAGLDKDVVENE